MRSFDPARLARLLRQQRWGCLATLSATGPSVSWVACAAEADFSALLLHLSHLAQHSRNLRDDPRVSLALSEPDDGCGDPQQLARLTLHGRVVPVAREHPDYDRLKACYLARLPDAGMLFGFADFTLYRLVPEGGRYVEGFASSHGVTAAMLAAAARVPAS